MSSTEIPSDFDFLKPRLNRRFLVWSLAVASSLSTTAMVTLPKPVWAQETDTSTADSAQEEAAPEKLTPSEFNRLLRAGDLPALAERIDAALAENPLDANLVRMNVTLGMSLVRSDQPAALARLKAQLERLLQEDDLEVSLLGNLYSISSYVTQLDKQMDTDAKLALVDTVIERIEGSESPAASSMLQGPITVKSRILIADDRLDDAKAFMDQTAEEYRQSAEEGSPAAFISFASVYHSNLSNEFPEAAEKIFADAEAYALQALEGDEISPAAVGQFISLKSSLVRSLTYTDVQRADEILADLEAKLESFKEHIAEDEATRLSVYERQLSSLRARIGPALEREKLIGAPAPELQPDAFVAMEETSLEELQGKVVLLDFWAVWCGPCIATFPHLIEWHDEYADRGLVIIGATKYYNYAWDEDAGKASRSQDEVEREAELAMLEKFRESYELKHGFVVSGKDSDFSQQYQVSGIPQAVLIDQEGKIAMIRVGSGEANAAALHAKIEELLGGE